MLDSFSRNAATLVDEKLAMGASGVAELETLVGLGEGMPSDITPSREVFTLLTQGLLLSEFAAQQADPSTPDGALEIVDELVKQSYESGYALMADEIEAYALSKKKAERPPDPGVEDAIARPGFGGRRAKKMLKARGYITRSTLDHYLLSVIHGPTNEEVGLVKGDEAVALRWVYDSGWPTTWIDSLQPELGRPEGLTRSEVEKLLRHGIVGVFARSGPDGEPRGVQYFVEGHQDGELANRSVVRPLLDLAP